MNTTLTSKCGALALMALLTTACQAPTDEPAVGTQVGALQTAEESALLAFVNDRSRATEQVLDVDCALRSDAARNIVAARDGVVAEVLVAEGAQVEAGAALIRLEDETAA